MQSKPKLHTPYCTLTFFFFSALKQGIAPTLLIVRVGLGLSTDDDVNTGLIISVETGAGGGLPEFSVPRGHNTTMELEARGTSEEFEGRGKDTMFCS
jgi:hypothetical protein